MLFNIYFHSLIGLLIRLLIIVYGEIHDKLYIVQYTDVDYHVFTDAAHYIVSGHSPYNRQTYRYTPLIAFLLTPNIYLHPAFGKILFSTFDIVVAYIMYKLIVSKGSEEKTAIKCSLMWLYNPFSIVISTRGNADAISAVLVLGTLLSVNKGCNAVTGFIHAVATHVRLYPLLFTLPLYIAVKAELPENSKVRQGVLKRIYLMLIPDRHQLRFIVVYIVALALTTFLCYRQYGFQFVYESMLYHIIRRDTRHNFSIYFYMLYLTSDGIPSLWQRVSIGLPQILLLVALSFSYGSRRDIDFCLLTQTFVMVTYNTVVTSQYFIWFLSILPVCLPFIAIPSMQAFAFFILWISAQIAWLLPAYLLEFQGRDTFVYIWLQSITFFSINIAILVRLIQTYKPSLHKIKSI